MASLVCAVVLAACVAAAPAAAQTGVEVDVELALAVDVSGSMGMRELTLQREGYVAAFRHPDVIRAIEQGLTGRIAVMYYEWAGPGSYRIVVPWRLVSNAAEAYAFADALAAVAPLNQRGTSISGALALARELFERNGFSGLRRVIDVSGDGPNNAGEPVTQERDLTIARGIVINGLPLQFDRSNYGFASLGDLGTYYEDCVIGGPGAFVFPVDDIDLFDVAVRRKLVLEIAGMPARLIPVQLVERPPTDCLIGEKLRQQRMFLDRP